jgi:hypothetical protein
MGALERLSHLFAKYDKEKELFLEHVRREGLNAVIRDEAKRGWPHVDEPERPE